jgi:hypothetical protein
MMYRKEFINAWQSSRSRMPIDVWAKAVGSKLPAFSHPEDIYAPVMLDIKVAGGINDSNGSVKLSVAPTDSEWYPKLIEGLEEMTGKRNLAAVNYLGEPIKDMDAKQLTNAGEIDIIDTKSQRVVRLDKVVPPPMHMSTEKAPIVKQWWETNRAKLVKTVAKSLEKLTMDEIAANTMKDGPLQKTIEQQLCSGVDWSDFIATYGMDNVAKNANPKDTATFISKGLLHSIRTALKANKPIIRKYHANAAIGDSSRLWNDDAPVATTNNTNAFSMYRDIVEDALHNPRIGAHMVDTILHGYERIGVIANRLPRRVHCTKSKISSEVHPVASYYSKIHYPTHGKLPGHVMDQYNQNKVQSTKYPGDAKVAFNIYNMLTGKTVLPDSTPKMPPLVPIGTISSIATNNRMPPLVPIGTIGSNSKMPPLVPIGSTVPTGRMPPLVPIDYKFPELEDFLEPRMPPLVPIGTIGTIGSNGSMPPLVPIGSTVPTGRMPPLVPIEAYPELGEPIWSMDNMPKLEDFL